MPVQGQLCDQVSSFTPFNINKSLELHCQCLFWFILHFLSLSFLKHNMLFLFTVKVSGWLDANCLVFFRSKHTEMGWSEGELGSVYKKRLMNTEISKPS